MQRCSVCKRHLPFDRFHRRKARKTGLKSACRECTAVRTKVYNAAHGAARLLEYKIYLDGIKAQADKCNTCGAKCGQSLEFAHWNRADKYRTRSRKTMEIGQLQSIKLIDAELPKGRWLCHTCHLKETKAENKQSKSQTKSALYAAKYKQIRYEHVNQHKMELGACVDCDKPVDADLPEDFHFDHRNPMTKIERVSQMASDRAPLDIIDHEMGQCCDLRCHDCHKKRGVTEGHSRMREEKCTELAKKQRALYKARKWNDLRATFKTESEPKPQPMDTKPDTEPPVQKRVTEEEITTTTKRKITDFFRPSSRV
jgi:hypothetical protein